MSAALSAAFVTQALTDHGVGSFYEAVSGRFYLGAAPENASLPLSVCTIRGSEPDQQFGGKVRVIQNLEVESFVTRDSGAAAAQAIDDKLFAECDQAIVASVTGFDRATIRCTGRGILNTLEDAFSVTSTYAVDGTTT